MQKFLLLFVVVFGLVACTTSPANQPPTYTQPTGTVAPTPTQQAPATPTPTKPASYPVCNEKATNAPCVLFASIQDAAKGESETGASVRSGISKGVVWVMDDITNVKPSVFGPASSLDEIKLQCFNIQQGLWYGLKSTINPDGSTTVRKSTFTEVDITFIDHHRSNATFASCRLTSAGADRIDRAGMWDDGDYVGAWKLYDNTSYQA
jgi:hypothetical protein